MQRGEIYFVNLDPVKGREQASRRPVLVVSVDTINRLPLVVSVVIGTDAANVTRDYPTNVRASAKETGLPLDTIFMCFQLRALDHGRFTDPKTGKSVRAGLMPRARMAEVEAALRHVLGL